MRPTTQRAEIRNEFETFEFWWIISSPSYKISSNNSRCAVIPSCNWKIDLNKTLYQDDCNFDKGQNITEEGEIQNLEDCVSHCFNVTRCSHFSYNRNSKSCSLKEITPAQLKPEGGPVRLRSWKRSWDLWLHSQSMEHKALCWNEHQNYRC